MAPVIDKATIKEALKELMTEESSLFKVLLREVIIEEKANDAEFEYFLKKNFDRYDETFKALA